MGSGRRSALIVPMKPENRTPRDPGEGSEASGHGTDERKHDGDIGLGNRVNETSADSGNGEADAASRADHAVPSH
jgi:hypothetical protein